MESKLRHKSIQNSVAGSSSYPVTSTHSTGTVLYSTVQHCHSDVQYSAVLYSMSVIQIDGTCWLSTHNTQTVNRRVCVCVCICRVVG